MPCLIPAHRRPPPPTSTTSPASAPAYTDTPLTRPRMKYAASLDQGGDLHYFSARPPTPPLPSVMRRRPPLQHGVCFDQSDFEFTARPPARSIAPTDETPETPSGSSEPDLADLADVFRSLEDAVPESRSFGDAIEASYERSYKNRTSEYFYDRAGPSSENSSNYFKPDVFDPGFSFNDPLQIQRMSVTALFEKFCADERQASLMKPLPVRQASESTFRTSRLKGVSADRISGGFIKKTRGDRISTSSLGDQPPTTTGSCFSIFEKRRAKFGKLEKSKRLSTSALYDQSPTENLTKARIRSSETVTKINLNSEDFHSRYSSPGENPSHSDHAPTTSRSDNSMHRNFVTSKDLTKNSFSNVFNASKNLTARDYFPRDVILKDTKFKFSENPLERASVAKLYEKFCYDDKPLGLKTPPSADLVSKLSDQQPSVESEPKSAKTEPFSAASLSELTSDIMSSTIMTSHMEQTIFNFDLEVLRRKSSENKSEILSPGRSTTNFDLETLRRKSSEIKSEILSPDRSTRSTSVSNTVQLLFEDPRSNRTSISDLYEPCFSASLAPKRPSFKRDIARHWDLNTLDLRPIDDESPTTSKFTSGSSPDDILQNFDTKSNNSEVFMSSEVHSSTFDTSERNGKAQTLEDINEGDSIDDATSGRISPGELENLPKMSSRPSMQKLEPYRPRAPKAEEDFAETPSSNNASGLVEAMAELSVKSNCMELENTEGLGLDGKEVVVRVKKEKQKDSVALRKRTRCFPL